MDGSPITSCFEEAAMTTRSAVFRVDASPSIGSGHVRRCLVLAEALAAAGWRVGFASVAGTKEAVPSLERSGFACHLVAGDDNSAAALRDLVGGDCDLLVVDHYGLDARLERACRPLAKRILVIDDLADRPHDCDMLLDQTHGREASDYKALVPANCRILAGSEFALLDPRFRQARERLRAPSDQVRRVQVSFGGTDPAGATVRTLEALGEAKLGVAVDVALGTANNNLSRIRQLAAQFDPPATVHVSVDDMASLIAQADMVVGAGGVSALERCCLGAPSITITIADNQRKLADELGQAGATENLGPLSQLSAKDIAGAVARLASDTARRHRMRTAALAIADGLGAARVRAAWSPPLLAKDNRPVQLRLATIADAALMLKWQSAEGIRAYSRNPKAPEPAEHARWMQNKLADPCCIFHIILHGDRPAGVLRLDRQAGGGYEISILVAAEAQGKSIGGAALELAKRLLPDSAMRAVIHPDNAASIRMFERAGYRREGEEWILAPGAQACSLASA
jgi:UDP-2,4-diacetamido-2,4,6-trideoxy-beta-L-altropyranose hydrolase